MDFARVEAHSLVVEVEVARRVADSEVHAWFYNSDREVGVDGRQSPLVYPSGAGGPRSSLDSRGMQRGLLLVWEELI